METPAQSVLIVPVSAPEPSRRTCAMSLRTASRQKLVGLSAWSRKLQKTTSREKMRLRLFCKRPAKPLLTESGVKMETGRDYPAWSCGWVAAARAAVVSDGICQLVAAGRRVSTSLR